MFRKPSNNQTTPTKPASGRKTVPSVVSQDMHILGNVVSDGTIDFDGTIDGNIRCHTLVLRHNGKINGEVFAENVQVYGNVKGMIKAKSVQLHSTCCVDGIIMHEAIAIEDGAIIEGKIKRTNKAQIVDSEYIEEHGLQEMLTDGDDASLEPQLMDNLRLISG